MKAQSIKNTVCYYKHYKPKLLKYLKRKICYSAGVKVCLHCDPKQITGFNENRIPTLTSWILAIFLVYFNIKSSIISRIFGKIHGVYIINTSHVIIAYLYRYMLHYIGNVIKGQSMKKNKKVTAAGATTASLKI